ncbi:6-phosphogluconate dehydrogenase [Candidatus Pacearchaeota archaeon CG10_big_fil_rev_8_21_14_0_10_30_48]|nr:MAG: 6-phosphogluconate dehydrogenase [Candidatus Pacearchaeota archaeon CG10_big_fil_rev_8_21_14_0_10_30_48]
MVNEVGMIGIGRMGFGMSQRLLKNKIRVVGYDRSKENVDEIKKKGAVPAYSIEELVSELKSKKKVVWLMLPAGKITTDTIKKVLPLLNSGDIIVDGANDFYKNAEKNAKLCKSYKINFFDCGVSGGIHGLEKGYPLMIGGSKKEFKHIEPLCKALAPSKGYGYFGVVGSGFYVKSIHNIIEYVYLQGIAEGIELLDKKKIDLVKATEVWQEASVIKSWLIDLTNKALKRKDFKDIEPNIMSVTIKELQDTKKSVKGYSPAFDVAVKIRKDKSNKFVLGKKTIAAVRNEFGGHKVMKK